MYIVYQIGEEEKITPVFFSKNLGDIIYIHTHAVGGVPCAFSPHPRFAFLKWTIAPSQTFSPPKYFLGLTNILTAHKNFYGGKLKVWYKRTNNIRLFSPYLVQLYYTPIKSHNNTMKYYSTIKKCIALKLNIINSHKHTLFSGNRVLKVYRFAYAKIMPFKAIGNLCPFSISSLKYSVFLQDILYTPSFTLVN